jgi:hypothetical protein
MRDILNVVLSRFYSRRRYGYQPAHLHSPEITADLPYPPSPESTKASPRRISPELRLSTLVTSNAQIEKRASIDCAYRRNIFSRNDRHHRDDRCIGPNHFSQRDHFRYSLSSEVLIERCRYTVCHNSKSIYDEPRCNKRVKIHVRFYRHENVIFPYEYHGRVRTIDAHIVRVSK